MLSHSKVEKYGQINPKQRGGFAKKKSKFTEEQITLALRQAESGTSVNETCPKDGNFRRNVPRLEDEVRRFPRA